MTISADIVTPVVDAAPGEAAVGRLRLYNGGSTAATLHVRTVGLDGAPSSGNGQYAAAGASFTIGPGQVSEVPVVVAVPPTLGIGEHAAAFEVASERAGDRPLLVPFTVSVASVERVELTPYPSTIRGRRRAKFRLDLVNHEEAPVDVAIDGSAPEVRVRFAQPRVQLIPGQHAVTTGKLKGPRRWSGELTQHTVVITARGRASATSVTAAFVQRPLFAAKLRMITAALVVIALWLGAIGAFAWWWSNRDDGDGDQAASSGQVDGVDTDGDGVIDTFYDENGNVIYGIDTDGDGVPDAFFDAEGNPVPDPRGDSGSGAGGDGSGEGAGEGEAAGPRSTVVRGTVKADGDITDIAISMTPIQLGQPAQRSGIMGFAGGPAPAAQEGDGPVGKIWSARFGATNDGTLNPVRQSEPIRPMQTNPQADGVWLFTDVALRQTYELVFSKPGYESQSFVITPPDDGSPIDLEVEMKAAVGAISGRVSGPSGPLGGVAITVTNGTLTFETTSATVGDVGSWSVEGLSTPAVYTVVGELRGYGTEVLQLRLDAGQTNGSANLNMRPGVGSISGRIVGPGGAPLGGVTVTATNGDESRTTSSLTEGNIGFFNIPQLDIPGTYTLTVAHEGYIGQTRRLPVAGAVGGVDFTLVRTTLQLTGQITSSAGGAGVANAGLTLSNGDLTFKVSTAIEPIPGTFVIDDLPTGNYTVTIEHYEHQTTTEFLTLTAGVTPPPLNVTLERLSDVPEIGNGTLVVEVVDNGADTAERREIKNATVKLVRTRTGEALPAVTQEAFNFRLTGLPVGTYTLFVTAPRYNPAPPRQVSVGLSEQRVEVALQRLGQASGRVVDRTDPSVVLNNYFISLYRQPESPGGSPPVFTLAARSDGTWQTPADSLIPGVYRVEIDDAASPPGYLVRDNQLLDPDVPGSTVVEQWMRFVVPEGAFDPVVVDDIQADPYPEITGRVFRASLASASGFVEVDHADLRVTMSCPGGTAVDAQVTDDAGVVGPSGSPLHETFRITKEQIDANNLTGNCQLTAQAGTPLLPATMALPGVDAGQTSTPADRRVSMALPVAPPSLGGRVFWRDGTTPVYLQGATVAAQPVTGFTPIDGTSSLNQVPNRVMSSLSTTTNAGGEWDLPGQIHGTTNYTFTADQFAPASVPFTVNDDGVLSHGTPVAANVTVAGGRYDVELSDPNPGTLSGRVEIKTTKPLADQNYGGVTITATPPVGPPIVSPPSAAIVRAAPTASGMQFTVPSVVPGTWQVGFGLPDNHAFFGTPPAPASVTQQLQPGATRAGFDTTLVELGRLELTILDASGNDLDLKPAITLTDGTVTVNGPLEDTAEDNEFFIDGIPVHASDPVGVARAYTLNVSLPGYDATSALVDGVPFPGGATALPVNLFAGGTVDFELRLPRYGSLSGEVFGRVTYDATDPGHLAELAIADLDLEVEPVDVFGNPVAPTPDRPAPTVTSTGNGFTVSGPPGHYRIVVNHPNYFEQADGNVPDDTVPGASTVVGVFLLENDVDRDIGDWELDIRTGELDLTALDSLEAGGVPVVGAEYFLFFESDPDPVLDGPVSDVVLGDGRVLVDGLLPGTYKLEIRRFATPGDPSSAQVAFPAITSIVIGNSVAGSPPARTTVRAPLPSLWPSATGQIQAINQYGSPGRHVPLPVPDGSWDYIVTTEYVVEEIEVDGVPVPNDPDDIVACVDDFVPDPTGDDIARCEASVTGVHADGILTYTFQNMPYGVHEVTIADETVDALAARGYDLVGPQTVEVVVGNSGPNPADVPFVFVVDNVDITVTLGDDDEFFEVTSASLTWADDPGFTPIVGVQVDAANGGNQVVFSNVSPQLTDYQITVAAALHALYSGTIPVTPSASGTNAVALDPPMQASRARVGGSVGQIDSGSTPVALSAGGVVELLDGGSNVVASFTVPVGETRDEYQFDVLTAGSYRVRVRHTSGYTTTTTDQVTIALGTVTVLDTDPIERHATLNVTIENGQTLAGEQIQVRREGSSTLIAPATSGRTPAPDNEPTASFSLPAGDYRIVVTAGNYDDTTYPAAPQSPISLVVGGSASVPFSLDRHVQMTVGGTGTTAVTVGLYTDETTPVLVDSQTRSAADGPFSFHVPPSSPSFDDNLFVRVSATGFRTQRVNAPFALDSHLSATLAANVTLTNGAINSGETAANEAGGTVTATSAEGTRTGSASADGYTVANLTNSVTGASLVWTIAYDKPGVGQGSVDVTIPATGSVAAPAIPVTPRQFDVTVNVRDQSNNPLSGATVTIGGAVATEVVGTPGTYVREDVNETFTLTWSVALDGYVTQSNTTALTGNLTLPTVTLVSRAITMTVEGNQPGPNPDLDAGVTFQMCRLSNASDPNSACASPGLQNLTVTNLTGGSYRFVAPLPAAPFPARYRVVASHADYENGSTTFLISVSGGVPSPNTLALVLEPDD